MSLKKFLPIYLLFLSMGMVDAAGPMVSLARESFALSITVATLLPFLGYLMFGLLSIPMGVLLKLNKALNENAISTTLKNLGQSGTRKLQSFMLSKNARWLKESGLTNITMDAGLPCKISLRLSKAILQGETVKSVCGNQEGAAKGFNTTKKGAKSYHPLLVFVSELKLNIFRRQEHRTFIDWFISVPAKITRSGHQMELKLYEHHFYKADWEEFDKLTEAA